MISYWLPMLDKHLCPSIKLCLSVFVDFCWTLLNLMAVKTSKIIFRKNFLNINQFKLIFVNCTNASVIIGTPFFSTKRSNLWLYLLTIRLIKLMREFSKIFRAIWKLLDLFVVLLKSHHIILLVLIPIVNLSLELYEGVGNYRNSFFLIQQKII